MSKNQFGSGHVIPEVVGRAQLTGVGEGLKGNRQKQGKEIIDRLQLQAKLTACD